MSPIQPVSGDYVRRADVEQSNQRPPTAYRPPPNGLSSTDLQLTPTEQPSNWTRLFGGLSVVAGVGETVIGSAIGLAGAATGAAPVLGGLITAHGLDTATAGLVELTSGKEQQTVTSKAITVVTGSETAGEVIDAGLGLVGGISGACKRIFKGFRKIKVPKARWKREWRFGELEPNVLGATDPLGNIIIQHGVSGQQLVQTLEHERVHRFLSPFQGPLAKLRAQLGAAAYENSHFLRFTEEMIAEGYATGSLRKGIMHPLVNDYKITAKELAGEATAYAGIVAGSARTGAVLGDKENQ